MSLRRFVASRSSYLPVISRGTATRMASSSEALSLKYTPERAQELKENYESVQREIDDAYASAESSTASSKPRLVAISKLKPASDIQALYDAGVRHFGENYIQEMVDKAEVLPKDIKWHFVGALQSNKSKLAASVENLFVLETVSSIKVADLLNKARSNSSPLGIYLQLNTSNEESKSGLPVPEASDEALQVATHVLTSCPNLIIRGLMTIGSWDASHDDTKPNPDFDALKKARTALVKALNEKGVQGAPKRETDWELSMGMSADFVKAVKEGSGSVRVGTRIFGERPPRR